MTLQLKKLPAFVRDAYAKYFASWDIYKAGNGPRPSKQKQVAVPDVPNFSVLMEHTGALNWRSSYVDPMSGERTCLLHGSLETISLSEATALHVDLEAMVAEGRSPRSAKLTVSQAFYNLVVPNSEKKRKKTLKEDIGKFKNEFERSIGHWKLGQIKPFMLRQEAERLRSKKTRPLLNATWHVFAGFSGTSLNWGC